MISIVSRCAGVLALIALLAGCASSPESRERRAETEADIDDILSLTYASGEADGPKSCLSEIQYRDFRPLDERYIVFEGARDKLWVNELRTRCLDLDRGLILNVRRFSPSRLCNGDRFVVTDWFSWPWYRRWPWSWGSAWGTGVQCTLGKFHPVTEGQVAEIETALERQ